MEAGIDLKSQYAHAMLPAATSDEEARQEFVKSLKLHLASKVAPGNRMAFTGGAAKRFEEQEGRAHATHRDVRTAMS